LIAIAIATSAATRITIHALPNLEGFFSRRIVRRVVFFRCDFFGLRGMAVSQRMVFWHA
jgi:hypothetical protein